MPYWMRDTDNGLTPPPNLEAEIFRQILLPRRSGSAVNRIYPMCWLGACPCERACQGAEPCSGRSPAFEQCLVLSGTHFCTDLPNKQRSMCRRVTQGHTHPLYSTHPPSYSPLPQPNRLRRCWVSAIAVYNFTLIYVNIPDFVKYYLLFNINITYYASNSSARCSVIDKQTDAVVLVAPSGESVYIIEANFSDSAETL